MHYYRLLEIMWIIMVKPQKGMFSKMEQPLYMQLTNRLSFIQSSAYTTSQDTAQSQSTYVVSII